MGRERIECGRRGEDLTVAYLRESGWEILERNWRCREGEIDIVARDGDTLVVCEVKTRTSERFGTPLAAVTAIKAARLRRLAVAWLVAREARVPAVRVDVVGILLDDPDQPPVRIEHVRGAA